MSAPGTGTIGVVIRTLNESQLLGSCLDALRRQRTRAELDVLVVDSGSTDGTVGIARSHGARVLELEPSAFDYSKALNLGIEHVGGDLVVSLSAHAVPTAEDWLELMTLPFDDPLVAGVGCRQLPWPDAPWREAQRLARQFRGEQELHSHDTGEVLFSNAASCIRRSAWVERPFTLPAVEDLDWARAVIVAGWTIVYEPRAAVYHSHRENVREQARRLIDISRAADSGMNQRTQRRTLREAAGLLYRDGKAILGLDEPARRRLRHLAEAALVSWYYVVDFTRTGTTAERRRGALGRSGGPP